MPNACQNGIGRLCSRRSGRLRQGSVKSPTTVFPGSNPGPATKNRRSSPVGQPGPATWGSGAGHRRCSLHGREARPAPSSKTPGDQPGCENTRTGPALPRGRRAARSGSCAKYVPKNSPCEGSCGRAACERRWAVGARAAVVLSLMCLAHRVIMSCWLVRAAENGLCTSSLPNIRFSRDQAVRRRASADAPVRRG
jgi:hypothetical protein